MRAPVVLVLAAVVTAGCATHAITVAPSTRPEAERLGRVRGVGCGSVLLAMDPYDFGAIDARMDGRVKRAYANALKQAPGATALADVTLAERWYWWLLGTTYCTTISGTAIR